MKNNKHKYDAETKERYPWLDEDDDDESGEGAHYGRGISSSQTTSTATPPNIAFSANWRTVCAE